MKKTFVLFSSILILGSISNLYAQDSLKVQKALIIGADLVGPVAGLINSENSNLEAYVSYRLNFKYYITAEAGYSGYNYSQYNYDYTNEGFFIRLGTDINLLKPKTGIGNHFAGIGLKYGVSVFSQETPWLKYDNYWGTTESSVPGATTSGHFFQLSGGIKAEVLRNILLGWTVKANLLLYHGAGKANRPLYVPGMGISDGSFRPSIAFHIAWMIPLSKKGSSD
ncbi:MAG: DUF6048 family protein [Marinilabiliaceae bacterium]|jgi:hypothetical protein|nr:DUF6048 family protein [Marinilabiliaceae bacterium]